MIMLVHIYNKSEIDLILIKLINTTLLKVVTKAHFNLQLISTTFDKFLLYPWCVHNHNRIKNQNMTQKTPQQLKYLSK